MGTSDFTIEYWAYITSGSRDSSVYAKRATSSIYGVCVGFNSSNQVTASIPNAAGNGWTQLFVGSAVSVNKWVHVALVRSAGTATLYLNGIAVASGAASNSLYDDGTALAIGTTGSVTPASYFAGYVSNLRVVKGVAVYTGSFLPAGPLAAVQLATSTQSAITGTQTSLLTCNAPTIIDGSTNAFTITNNGSAPVSTAIVPTFTNVTITGYTAPYTANYLIVAGGGAGAPSGGGGGGGGMLVGSTLLTAGQTYSITVGAGGTGGLMSTTAPTNGSNSLFNSITSIGGGKGGDDFGSLAGGVGGSGGGAGRSTSQRVGGNSVYGQGNPGGINTTASVYPAGGGGGAGGAGGNGSGGTVSGNGGAGGLSYITGSAVYYAGGGGGGLISGATAGTGGSGGGGNGTTTATGGAGTVNTGGGGGGSYQLSGAVGGAGGSGIVILSVPTINYTSKTTGSPTVTTSGTQTIISFTASGTYTA